MGKVWVLDTETKGTGARMVPLERARDAAGAEPLPVVRRATPRAPAPPAPRRPREFRVVDVMTRHPLADGVDLRGALAVLAGVRSVVDAKVLVRAAGPTRGGRSRSPSAVGSGRSPGRHPRRERRGDPPPVPLDWALVSENMPVLAAPRVPIPRRPAGALVARVAALAAGSFVAGAAALALLQRIGAPRARRRPGSVASRAFLVEIHLLGDRR